MQSSTTAAAKSRQAKLAAAARAAKKDRATGITKESRRTTLQLRSDLMGTRQLRKGANASSLAEVVKDGDLGFVADDSKDPNEPKDIMMLPSGQTIVSSKSWYQGLDGVDMLNMNVTKEMVDRINSRGGKPKASDENEYFKPLLPKRYHLTKYKSYQAQVSATPLTFNRYTTYNIKFYKVQQGQALGMPHAQIQSAALGDVNQGTEITWAEVNNIITSVPVDANVNDYMVHQTSTILDKSTQAIAIIAVPLDSLNAKQAYSFKDVNTGKEHKVLASDNRGKSIMEAIAEKIFLATLKMMHQLATCHGMSTLSQEGTLKAIWESLTFTVGTMDPTMLKVRNQAYMSAQMWYTNRAYKKLNEQVKMIAKPVTIETKSVLGMTISNNPEIVLPTFFDVSYEPDVRRRFQDQLSAIPGGSDTYLANTYVDRIIGLEPEARNVSRFGYLEDYDAASARWAAKRTMSSHKRSLSSFITKEQYNEAIVAIRDEINELTGQVHQTNAVEWPSVKIPSFQFVKYVSACFVSWGSKDQLDALVKSQRQSDSFRTILFEHGQTIPSIESMSLNYTLVSRYVFKREVMTPILDRVQFTKNLKSKYYIDGIMRMLPPSSLADWSWHRRNIGIILRKKQRSVLKGLLTQTKLSYEEVTYPFVQQAMYWFKVFDMSSMNLRRLWGMSVAKGISSNMDSQNNWDNNPWLEPFRRTREPRYKLMMTKASTGYTLDQWHEAYNYLAESKLRGSVRKRMNKMFAAMKKHVRVTAILANRPATLENQVEITQFGETVNPSFGLVISFFLCAAMGSTPSYHTKDSVYKGYSATNHYITIWLQALVKDALNAAKDAVDDLFVKMLKKFIDGWNTRYLSVGVEKGKPSIVSISELGDAKHVNFWADFYVFLDVYYPGVSTIIINKNTKGQSLDGAMEQENVFYSVKCQVYLYLAMFAELFETGMLMLQQYNAGYFKHISDKSYSVMVYAWFVWIQKLTEKHETLLTFVQAPITKAILIDITQKIGLMAKYFADDLRRPIRPDRVSSKTEKQDFEWQTFYDLIDLYKDMALLGDSSHTVDTVRRDLHPALRGDALNLEGQLGATDNSNVMDKLDFVQRVTRIRKKQQGKYQNIKGKKVRSVIPLTKEEEITLTLAQAKGGLLANHENANNANQDIIKDSSIGRYQKQVREARAVDPNQIMDNV